jgi:hypothetical protein
MTAPPPPLGIINGRIERVRLVFIHRCHTISMSTAAVAFFLTMITANTTTLSAKGLPLTTPTGFVHTGWATALPVGLTTLAVGAVIVTTLAALYKNTTARLTAVKTAATR